MLKTLFIKNYAVIDELSADFSSGLNILTGETGAGKSIIIDALGLIIGDRASTEVVRAGSEKAVIEGVFSIAGNKKLAPLLATGEIEERGELLVRREVSVKGQSRCFANDSPITIALLKQIGELLVDLHGQHEHQSLLRSETHIDMVDDFGGLDGIVAEYQKSYKTLRASMDELGELIERKAQLLEKRDFYAFQIQEIDAVHPVAGEEEQLESELKILENSEKLFGTTAKLYELFYEGEQSVHDLLVVARNQLHDLADIDRQFADAARECSSAEAIISELAKFIQGYNARVEFNPERLDHLRERLGRLALLKKKYGGSLETLIGHREKIGREVALAENFDDVIENLSAQVESMRAECAGIAQRLSVKRHEVAKKIDRSIVQELAKLGIAHARFSARISQVEVALSPGREHGKVMDYISVGRKRLLLNARGYDNVEFYVSTNLGEEERPLVKVASGGEVSRIMLALKSILAKSDRLPVLIFDEIDVGVSGRVARSVGLSLKSLSDFHQVIAITHLPQIAGLADTHFVVQKTEQNGRSVSTIMKLSLDEQVTEVARLMSGADVTEAGLEGARELMGLK